MQFGFREPYARYDDETLFNGTQLDDFLACAATTPKRVLVLGSGPGAACFTLARALPNVERIDGVDADPREVALARSIRDYLGIPVVEFHLNDASAHLERAARGSHYDVILIDLFEGMNYSPLNFTAHFWRNVDDALAEDGVVLVNMWGYPEHLRPLEGSTPVSDLLSVVGASSTFDRYFVLSHLRNTTVVLGRGATALRSLTASWVTPGDGDAIDAMASRALKAKVAAAGIHPIPARGEATRAWTLEDLQTGFNQRLSALAGRITSVPERESLRGVLDSQELSVQAIHSSPEFRRLVAATYHSDHVTVRQRRLSWLPGWLVENWKWATTEDPEWAYGSAAWHIASTGASLRHLTKEEQRFAATAFPELNIDR